MNDRVQRVHEQIDRDRLRRHSNRVLHGHPSPTLWDEPDVPVDDILKWRRQPRSGPRKDLLVYVGIPFCLPTTPDGVGREARRAALTAAETIQAKLALGDHSLLDPPTPPPPAPPVPSLEQAARQWLAMHSQLGPLRASTQALYTRTLRTYVYPRFGAKLVTEVARADVRDLVVDLLAQGRSGSLVRNVVAPVRQLFNQLIEDGLDKPNPAARIGRYLRDRHDPAFRIDPLTPEEEAWFLATARIHCPRHYALFLCALRTGLRLIQNGESLAYVKEQMGHHSIKVTVDIYGKLVPGANKAALDRLDAVEAMRMAQPSATPAQPEPRNRESAGPGRRLTPRIQMVELRGIELKGHGPFGLEEEAIPLPPSRRRGSSPVGERQ